jgi:hypothetical protein
VSFVLHNPLESPLYMGDDQDTNDNYRDLGCSDDASSAAMNGTPRTIARTRQEKRQRVRMTSL